MYTLRALGIVLVVIACNHLMPPSVSAGPNETVHPPQVAVPAAGAEQLLVDVVFNRRSAGTQVCFQQDNEYWIPYDLFQEQTGLKAIETNSNPASYRTSLGTMTFNRNALKVFEGTLCISLSELKKSFLVAGRFNSSAFAVQLDVPWFPVSGSAKKALPKVMPDIPAPNSSLSFLRIEPDLAHDFEGTFKKNLFVEAGGRIAEGVWDITFEGDPEESFSPTRYHWTTYNRNFAVRIGTGSSDIYPLVSNNAMTGLQFGWNNHDILNQLDFERYSDSDVFLTLDRTQQRSIEGNGPPAAIAELRLDGVAVARQRIGLDGRFNFSNVRMTSDLRKTEVYLYERSLREKPLEVLDYTISILNRTIPAHEILVRGGAGVTGNPLDNSDDKHTLTGFAHVQYGVDDRITLEAAIENNPQTGREDILAGSVISLGSNWAAALYGARSNGRFGADVRLEGHGSAWDFSGLSSWQDRGFSSGNTEEEESHTIRLSTNLLDPFDLLFYGRYDRINGEEVKKFLLPGVYWTVSPWLMFSAIPDDDEKYRYEASLRLGDQSDISVVYDKKVVTADCRIDLNKSLISRIIHSYAVKTEDNLTSLYLDWYPGGFRYDMFRLGLSRSDDELGFSGSWSKFVNAGLRFTLQYSYNMNNAHQLETDEDFIIPSGTDAQHFLALALTWDIGFSKTRTYPINRTAISHTRGGLAGSLDIMNNTRLKPSDINDVDILINGRKLGQRQVDGTFFVGNLIPGVYSVDIDAEKLPLELNVARKSLKAEVRNGAVTEVNFPVYAEYGMAGRVTDHSGSGQADALITVRDIEGKTAATTFTNAFGYYRIDGLRPGNYTVDAAESETGSGKTAPREVSIKDDYLFEINFSISADRRPAVPRSGNSSETMPDEKRSSEKHPDKPEGSFLPDHAALPDTSAVNRAVQFGVFRNHKNASALVEKLKAVYPESSLTILNDHGSFKVRLLRSLLSLQEIMRSAEGLSLKPLIIREEEKNQGTTAS